MPKLALIFAVSALALAAQPGPGLDLFDDPLPPGAVARMGTLRLRASNRVTCLALSPDGKTLLSGTYDTRVQLWDVVSGRPAGEWAVGSATLHGLQYSHDGKIVVAACGDGGVRLLDAATGSVRRLLRDTARRSGPIVATLSPDGRALVTIQRNDRQLCIWDVVSGKVKHRLPGISGGPGYFPVAFLPDGKQFITPWNDGRLHLVDVASGKSVRPLQHGVPTGPGRGRYSSRRAAMALSPDGKTLVYRSSSDRTLHVVDVASGKELRRIDREGRATLAAGGLAISPNGRFLHEASTDGVLRIWGLASGKVVRELSPPAGVVQHLCLSRDGKFVVAASGQVIHLWDADAGTLLHSSAGHHSGVTRLAFTPDGKRLVSADGNTLRVWEATTGCELHVARNTGGFGPSALSVSPDGGTVSWVGPDAVRYSLRVGLDREPARLSTPRNLSAYSQYLVSPDGRFLACIHEEDRKLRLVHLIEDRPDRELAILSEDHRFSLAFSPDGRLLALAAPDHSLTLFETATGLELRKVPPAALSDERQRASPIFSRDGRTLLFCDGELRLIEVLTGGERARFPPEPRSPEAMALSDDGRLVARGQADGGVIAYDAWAGRELLRRNGGQGAVLSLAIRRDNRLLASGGANTTSLVWEVPPLPPPPRLRLGDDAAWNDLGSPDAATAFRAMLHLLARPGTSVKLIVERLQPKPRGDPKRAAKLIEALDSDTYAEREKARGELEKMGRAAEEELRKAVRSPSLEVKRRAEELLARLEGGPAAPQRLRRERAVEVLERIGGPRARSALRQLLETRPDAAFAESLRAALARLGEGG